MSCRHFPIVEAPDTSPLAGELERLVEIMPWFTHNALIHYLSPRGLEQYSGGGWGTRDVTQGPVEMLFALGKTLPVRDLLLRVMAAQKSEGDWPQWFMFFDRDRDVRAGDSHGDIVFWPLLALAQYLLASGDTGVLDERVPYFDGDEPVTVWDHVEKALAVIRARIIPGTALAAYGHGDWNDSLQPADPAMRETMCSAWTVTLHYQTLTTLAQALRLSGVPPMCSSWRTKRPPCSVTFSGSCSSMMCLLVTQCSMAIRRATCCIRAMKSPAFATARSR